jgi:hypothetical protein
MDPGRNAGEYVAAQLPLKQIVRAAHGHLAFGRVRGCGEDIVSIALPGYGGIVSAGIVSAKRQRVRLLAIELRREDCGERGE